MPQTVGVIGTGAGGLSAAAHLSKRGIQVAGFEQRDELGGLLALFERAGFEFDPGVHHWHRWMNGRIPGFSRGRR